MKLNIIKEIKNDLSVFPKRTRIMKISLMILLTIIVTLLTHFIDIWYVSFLIGVTLGAVFFTIIMRYGLYRAAIKEHFEKGTPIHELMFKYNISGIILKMKIDKQK